MELKMAVNGVQNSENHTKFMRQGGRNDSERRYRQTIRGIRGIARLASKQNSTGPYKLLSQRKKSRIDSNHHSVAENDHLVIVLPFMLHHSLIGQMQSFYQAVEKLIV